MPDQRLNAELGPPWRDLIGRDDSSLNLSYYCGAKCDLRLIGLGQGIRYAELKFLKM